MTTAAPEPRVRHIVSLSGGKDSSALAIYLRGRVPDLEYVFCDTGEELPETYEYLERLQAYLGQPIVRLRAYGKTLREMIQERGGIPPLTPRALVHAGTQDRALRALYRPGSRLCLYRSPG
jgi:3'-phosphoadenosine 5'-phosphosulfate sulfotransferase (PAPS reductase)/FAD synthetase